MLAAGAGWGCWKQPAAKNCEVSLPQAPVSLLLLNRDLAFTGTPAVITLFEQRLLMGLISLNTDATCVL